MFGFFGDHVRHAQGDVVYRDVIIDFKTKHISKGCTTKRRFKLGTFKDVVLIVNDYKDKNKITEQAWIVFPPALEEWREHQDWKLNYDNGTIPCYKEIDTIRSLIDERDISPSIEAILQKITNQVHRNDPAIPKSFFSTNGEYTSINRRKTKVKHSHWCIRVPKNRDRPEFVRQCIDDYITWKENTNNG